MKYKVTKDEAPRKGPSITRIHGDSTDDSGHSGRNLYIGLHDLRHRRPSQLLDDIARIEVAFVNSFGAVIYASAVHEHFSRTNYLGLARRGMR